MRLFRSRKPKSVSGHSGSEVLVYDHIEHSEQQQHHPPSASAANATTIAATTMSQQHAFSTTTTTTTGTATAHGLTVDETQQLNNEVVVVAWDTSVESVAATTAVPVLLLVDDIDNNNHPHPNRTTDRVDASYVNVAAAAATITNRTHSTSAAMVTDCQDDWMKGDFAIDNHEQVTTPLLVEPWPDTTKNVDAGAGQAMEQERNLIREGNNQGYIHASVDREGIDRARRNIYANNYWERMAVEEANRMAAYRKREEELGLCQTSRLVPIPTSTTGSAPPVAPSTMKEPALSSTFGKEYDVANYDTQEYKTSDYEVSGYKSVYES